MGNSIKMKKVSLILSAVVMTAMILGSCGESVLNEVTIGKTVWMSENLNVDKFRNGDPIPEAKTPEEWEEAGENEEPAWCYYNNNPENGDRYGKLYNWYAVNDPRGLAPEGWKIPSDEDWTSLTDFLGGDPGKKMKSTEFWANNDGESGNGTNDSGFSGLPGGWRNSSGPFRYLGKYGYWWSSTKDSRNYAFARTLRHDTDFFLYRLSKYKKEGLSVRCLRD